MKVTIYPKQQRPTDHVAKTILREVLRPLPLLVVLYLAYHMIKAYSQ